jgi:hypothetical protein
MTPQRANVILGIVVSVLMVALCAGGARQLFATAARTETRHKLKGVVLAVHCFANQHNSRLPPAFNHFSSKPGMVDRPVSMHVHLLPYVGQQEIYRIFAEGQDYPDLAIAPYCTSEDGTLAGAVGVQCFAGNLRVFSRKGSTTAADEDLPCLAPVEPGGRFNIGNIPRGTSNTVAFATKLARCGEGGSRYAADPTSPWAAFFGQNVAMESAHFSSPAAIYQWAPRGNECLTRPLMAQTYVNSPLQVALVDGVVREVKGDLDPAIWNTAMSPQ